MTIKAINVRNQFRGKIKEIIRGDVVKCTVFLADIAEWPAFNTVYREFFKKPFPARSAFAASGLAMNARVELECIAYVPQQRSR